MPLNIKIDAKLQGYVHFKENFYSGLRPIPEEQGRRRSKGVRAWRLVRGRGVVVVHRRRRGGRRPLRRGVTAGA